MTTRAVFFDAVGTLFRVRGSVGSAYARVAARHGVAVDEEQIDSGFREAFRSMPPLCFPGVPESELAHRERAWWEQVVQKAFAGVRFDDFEHFFADLFEHFAQADAWELFPDTVPAVTALMARGLRLGVVSNFDGRLVRVCEGLGIARYFHTMVMSGRVGYSKPDPQIFAVALRRVGVAAPEAMHVGDGEHEDIVGARAAGLRAVLIARGGRSGGCVPQLADLRELVAYL
jgi:putative hydrolase of the HAD superfamily